MREGDVFDADPGEAFHIGRHNETGEEREASLEDRISDILPDLRERFTEDKRWKKT